MLPHLSLTFASCLPHARLIPNTGTSSIRVSVYLRTPCVSLGHQVKSLVYLDNSIRLSPFCSSIALNKGVTEHTQWLEPLTFDSTPKGQRRLSILSFMEGLSGDIRLNFLLLHPANSDPGAPTNKRYAEHQRDTQWMDHGPRMKGADDNCQNKPTSNSGKQLICHTTGSKGPRTDNRNYHYGTRTD